MFIADLHIHSRFSRATSRQLTVPHLAAWARVKGIDVLGTGDLTHPVWREELRRDLAYDEDSGFYRLACQAEKLQGMEEALSGDDARGPLFCLQTEISSIYKRGGRVRKVHNLVYLPTLDDADRLSAKLALIGNIASDGRPILGLDSRDLLEMVLETCPGAFFVPAHIWTPWFSLFGSRSGFNSMEECFGDLADEIFALETGLSSDPAMNRHVSALDGYALVSNSDAHSGANLGREANLFEGKATYAGLFGALRNAAMRNRDADDDCRFLGTLEFYPEEGKYHLDGHRACDVCLDPVQTRARGGICPVCGKPLTVGVLHRVMELADRSAPAALPDEPEARPLIPLAEVTAELLGVGPASVKAKQRYAEVLRDLGTELSVLCSMPVSDIRAYWDALGEAVDRLRSGRVFLKGGYDGEYGTVRVFAPDELDVHRRNRLVPAAPATRKAGNTPLLQQRQAHTGIDSLPLFRSVTKPLSGTPAPPQMDMQFSDEQNAALLAGPGPVLVLAGPGAGKTRVLVGRMLRLIREGTPPDRILAVTFTRRAAREMRDRLQASLIPESHLPHCDTLHGRCWQLALTRFPALHLLAEEEAIALFSEANPQIAKRRIRDLWESASLLREKLAPSDVWPADLLTAYQRYAAAKYSPFAPACLDFTDLLEMFLPVDMDPARRILPHGGTPVANLATDASALPLPGGTPYSGPRVCLYDSDKPLHLLVDEVQDCTPLQLIILKTFLAPDGKGLFAIGDPDQSIYGFRGAGGDCEKDLMRHWPSLSVLRLARSFRASQSVLNMAQGLMHDAARCGNLTAFRDLKAHLHIFTAPDDSAEARWITHHVKCLLGATSHSLLDGGKGGHHGLDGTLAPSDIAVLVRLKAQMGPIARMLEEAGIPVSLPARADFSHDERCTRLIALAGQHLGLMPPRPSRDAQGAPGRHFHNADLPPWPEGQLPAPMDMRQWLDTLAWAGHAFTVSKPFRNLCGLWHKCGTWKSFFEHLAWRNEAELINRKAEKVQLLTIHASKGLEFRAVFLPGLDEGLLPLKRALLFPDQDDPDADLDGSGFLTGTAPECDEDEERRLFYVGLTRASEAVFISTCHEHILYGKKTLLQPSSFVADVRRFCLSTKLGLHTRKVVSQASLL
ncbi:MAG: UvrD-helicase domain-containing protein [Desulfovibrio sp.]|nr:UvrD-helicase domain-containing protein [Desulfovibrio sp.]